MRRNGERRALLVCNQCLVMGAMMGMAASWWQIRLRRRWAAPNVAAKPQRS